MSNSEKGFQYMHQVSGQGNDDIWEEQNMVNPPGTILYDILKKIKYKVMVLKSIEKLIEALQADWLFCKDGGCVPVYYKIQAES